MAITSYLLPAAALISTVFGKLVDHRRPLTFAFDTITATDYFSFVVLFVFELRADLIVSRPMQQLGNDDNFCVRRRISRSVVHDVQWLDRYRNRPFRARWLKWTPVAVH